MFASLVWEKFERLLYKDSSPVTIDMKAKYFLNALEKLIPDPFGPKIIVFSVEGYNKNNPRFIQDLSRLLDGTPLGNKVYPIDVSSILNQDDYFKLDAHINKEGHQKLASYLSNVYFNQASLSSDKTPL